MKIICDNINEKNSYNNYNLFYTRPFLEAVRLDVCEVVRKTLNVLSSDEAVQRQLLPMFAQSHSEDELDVKVAVAY